MQVPRMTVRRWMIVVGLAALAFAYLGSYYRLSRRGMDEAAAFGCDGSFFYISFDEAVRIGNQANALHQARRSWYAPLNWIDRKIYGAPAPEVRIMFKYIY
jgi:hypothetical protein